MKKFKLVAFILAVIVFASVVVTGAYAWNRSIFDTTWSFERAIISLPDAGYGWSEKMFRVEGPVESWTDFEGSDMIQVKINGVVYLTHSSNVILISE